MLNALVIIYTCLQWYQPVLIFETDLKISCTTTLLTHWVVRYKNNAQWVVYVMLRPPNGSSIKQSLLQDSSVLEKNEPF